MAVPTATCASKAGAEEWMKEPYDEGVASQSAPSHAPKAARTR